MTDFGFFSFLWVPRRPVFDGENAVVVNGVFLTDEFNDLLTDEFGNFLVLSVPTTLTLGNLYRYD